MLDWEKDEENNWDDPAPISAETEPNSKPPAPRRHMLIWVSVVAVLVMMAGVFVMVRIDGRMAAVEEQLTAEVLSSERLLLQAAENQDADLFVSNISGVDMAWVDALVVQVNDGRFQDRSMVGLTRLSAETDPTITFNPELAEAIVERQQPFAIQVGNGLTETVVLTETSIYRPSQDRWLLAPPTAEFWGPRDGAGGKFVSVRYPERDAELARQLMLDLDAQVARLCASRMQFACPPDLHLLVDFSQSPASLQRMTTAEVLKQRPAYVTLPTPSLIGEPVDDRAYNALLRGYAAPVLTAAIRDAVGWECCDHPRLVQALIDYHVAELLGLPWQVSAEAADEALSVGLSPEWLMTNWRIGEGTAWAVSSPYYLFADFLLQHPNRPTVPMLIAGLASAENEEAWLGFATAKAYQTTDALESAWWRYLAEHDSSPETTAETVAAPVGR